MNQTSAQQLRFLVFATGVTAIGGFLFGYDTAVINGANSYFKAHLNLNPAQEGTAGASAILGCIPGAMFAGFLSDKFGRKKMLFLCALLYAVSGLLSAIPNTFNQFLAARFLSGLGIGASSMICPVYIAEISPEKWRGRLGTLFQLGIVTGIFLTLFVNKVIQGMGDDAWNAAYGWRWMLGMEVVPAAVFIALLFAVPESPRWLAQKGRESEARSILQEAVRRQRVRHAEGVCQNMTMHNCDSNSGTPFRVSLAPGFSRVCAAGEGENRFNGFRGGLFVVNCFSSGKPLKRLRSADSLHTGLKPDANESQPRLVHLSLC